MQFSSSKQEPEKKTFKCYSCCFILPSLLTLTNLAYRLLFRYVNITIKPQHNLYKLFIPGLRT